VNSHLDSLPQTISLLAASSVEPNYWLFSLLLLLVVAVVVPLLLVLSLLLEFINISISISICISIGDWYQTSWW